MKSPKFSSVEEYLASVDHTKERTLRSVIDLTLTQSLEDLNTSVFADHELDVWWFELKTSNPCLP
jgi:hypothetical protein